MKERLFFNVCFIVVLVLLAIVINCNNDPGDTKTPTPATTGTPTPAPTDPPNIPPEDVYIEAYLTRENIGGYEVVYGVYVNIYGNHYETALVTVDGPSGLITLPHDIDGEYNYSSSDPSDLLPGSNYTVTVTVDDFDYIASFLMCGDITLTSTQATWNYEGNSDMINITGATTISDGPDIDSPYPYSLNTGTNTVILSIANSELGSFPGASSGCSLQVYDLEMSDIVIP